MSLDARYVKVRLICAAIVFFVFVALLPAAPVHAAYDGADIPETLLEKLNEDESEVGNWTDTGVSPSLALKRISAARKGSADAQKHLAARYLTGNGFSYDPQTAAQWLVVSVLHESPEDVYYLVVPPTQTGEDEVDNRFRQGYQLQTGMGGLQNYIMARRHYMEAADRGYAAAQNNLAILYLLGHGLPVNRRRAAGWLEKAANSGLAEAQYNLGLLYLRGLGMDRDDEMALGWLYRAASENEYAPAQAQLGLMYFYGEGVDRDYAASAAWLQRASENGIAIAQRYLGYLYQSGWGVPEASNDLAAYWFEKSAIEGRSDIHYWLGMLYQGWGMPNDNVRAYRWYALAYEEGGDKALVSGRPSFGLATMKRRLGSNQVRQLKDDLAAFMKRIEDYEEAPHRVKSRP